MTTLADLRAQLRLTLADETTWPDATLDGWISDAVRFYSAEFPRADEQSLELEAGEREYALPDGCLAVTDVEYPAGREPASYLVQGSPRDLLFRAGGPVYAIRAGKLILAQSPSEGETATISFLAARRPPGVGGPDVGGPDVGGPDVGDDEATVDVPAAHLEALVAFCEFRAHWERETAQAVSVETVSLTLAQLGENARRAWNRYREVIDRLRWLSAGDSAVVTWGG
jgi:hypothetical protein